MEQDIVGEGGPGTHVLPLVGQEYMGGEAENSGLLPNPPSPSQNAEMSMGTSLTVGRIE